MTTRIVPLKLDDEQQILIEVAEIPIEAMEGPQQVSVIERAGRQIEAIDSTIRNFSRIVIQSLSKLAHEDRAPEKVSLEFAIKFVGEAAIPTIAKGSAEASLSVAIEWTLEHEGEKR